MMKIELEIDPTDLDSMIEEQWRFASESFSKDFRAAGCREGFERIAQEHLEQLAESVDDPDSLEFLAESFDLVRQAARIGLALVEARDRELAAAG